jgi:hypothetical protein
MNVNLSLNIKDKNHKRELFRAMLAFFFFCFGFSNDNLIVPMFFGLSGFAIGSGLWNTYEIVIKDIDEQHVEKLDNHKVPFLETCEIKTTPDDELVIIKGKCVASENYYEVSVPLYEFTNFYVLEKDLDTSMPSVSEKDKHFLISGVSPFIKPSKLDKIA